MHNFRKKIQRNFDFAGVRHPLVMSHAYVGYKYMADQNKVVEYKAKLLAEGYQSFDIEDCFDFVSTFEGNAPKKPYYAYFAQIRDGELDSLDLEPSKNTFKIISYEDGLICGYYFSFPHSLNLPENSRISKYDIANCFVSWWDSVGDDTFFKLDFWRAISWVEKEREWKKEFLSI